jgi:tetratricopeptide (TPR) repeat protein
LALGKYEMALESYNKSLEINSVDKKALNGKANALINLGRYEDALAYISSVIITDPTDAAAWNSKGLILEKLGRKARLMPHMRRLRDWDTATNPLSSFNT